LAKYKPTWPERKQLHAIGAGFHFERLAGVPQPSPSLRCSIIPANGTHANALAVAVGYDEEDAFHDALNKAIGGPRRQTPADVLAERDALKARIAELEARLPKAQAPFEPTPATEAAPTRAKAKVFDSNPGDSFPKQAAA